MEAISVNARLIEALELAGRIILENGGETYRVEDTVARMGHAFGAEKAEVFAVTSGIFMTLHFADGGVETAVCRCNVQSINLAKVDAVNQISRKAAAGQTTLEQAWIALGRIQGARPVYSLAWLLIASALSAGGFAVMFGGGWFDFGVSCLSGALIQLMLAALSRVSYSSIVKSLLGGLLCMLLPLLFHHYAGVGLVDAMVAGILMPLLPGLAMTNAVQDAMRGDMLSAVGHATGAILTAALVAGGAIMGSVLFTMIFGGLA